jgi:GntR family transcriptional regulator
MQNERQPGGADAADGLVRAPVYLQINRMLRAMIGGAGYRPGQQFLSEREVSDRFRVSRITANKALSQLVMTGDLEFRPGLGTFVRAAGLDTDLQALVSFTRKAELAGRTPRTLVLAFRSMRAADASDGARDALRLGGGDRVFYFERLRLADGIPFILERRHVAADLCPRLTRRRVAGSLYLLFTRTYGLTISGARETIRAVNLAAADAERLGVAEGEAALRVDAVGMAGERPLWVESTLYRGDLYEFHNELGTRGGSRSAGLVICNRPARPARGVHPVPVPKGIRAS